MRIAVFRAAEDGLRTAERLHALGHEAILAPVIEIVPTGEPVPLGTADILIFTSAHAVTMLDHGEDRSRFQHLPCYCVGGRTAAAARACGFHHIRNTQPDAKRLAGLMAEEFDPAHRVLLVAGRDRKRVLEEVLVRLGYAFTVAEVYKASAVPAWAAGIVASLSNEACEGALHYSLRSARLAFGLAEAAGLGREVRTWRHYGLSADIAHWLSSQGVARVAAAVHPDENHLLAGLEPSVSPTPGNEDATSVS